MVRFWVYLLAGLAILASGVGCSSLTSHCKKGETGPPDHPIPSMPAVQRINMEMRFKDAVGPLCGAWPHGPEQDYRALTDEQCRCQAAQVQGTARMLDAEADELERQLSRQLLPLPHDQGRQTALKKDVLRSSAKELRNLNAALALNLFYRIVETEALIDLQQESLQALDEGMARVRELKNKGFKSNEDLDELERQKLGMLADLTRLQLTTDELNTELSRLLELEDGTCKCKGRFWPLFTLHIDACIPDCDAAVAEGLARRPELFMLKRIAEDLDVKTLQTILKMLQSVNALIGLADAKPCLVGLAKLAAHVFGAGPLAREVETRRQQVNDYRNSRMGVIASEIRQDVNALNRRAQLIALLRQRAQSMKGKLDEVEAKSGKGLASFGQVMEARLQWLKGRAELVQAMTAWEREWVQLGLHKGILGLDCPHECKAPTPAVVEIKHETAFSTQLSHVLSEAPVAIRPR